MRSTIVLALLLTTAVNAANITYNVISLTNGTRTMGVIVDGQTYPLSFSENSKMLHSGVAPIASEDYRYTLLEEGITVNPENFTREPVVSNTVNEYYNRSWNKWELEKLPIILPSLPITNRIESDLHIDGQIPTIHFVGNQKELDAMHANQTNEDIEVSVSMTYMSLDKVKQIEAVTLQISGHSTRIFPKLSYKFKIPKDSDLFGYRRLKLRAMTGTDYSYMKEFLAYDIYNSVGLPTTQFSYVRLYMNDEPIGLFGLAENYKNPWIRNEFADGDKDFNQGTFYVADVNAGKPVGVQPENSDQSNTNTMNDTTSFVRKGGADLSYLGTNISLYSRGYYSVKEDPSEGEANFTRIMDLTKFISDASNTTTDNSVVDDWERKMDVDSFLRGMAMEILLSNCDGYFTLANNYLLYDDLENERLIFSGSDFDLTMGLVFAPTVISGNYSEYPGFSERPLSKMMNVPRFKNEFENLLLNITKGLVNNETLMPRIDQAYKMLTTDVEWDRSLPKKGRLALDSLLPGAGNQTSNMNMTNSTQPSNLTESDIEEFFRNGIPFEAAIYGPLPFNVSILLSLKEWITLRSDNILKFFNQTA